MIQQALTQLQALGYKEGDRVYIRLLLPKNIPLTEAFLHGMAWSPEQGKIVPVPIDGFLTLTQTGATFTRLTYCKQSGEWVSKRTHSDGLNYLRIENQRGYGIYLIPNTGGRNDASITRCPALFYECDDISKQQQWGKVSELSKAGFLPSLVVETRSSLHVYLLTHETYRDEWQLLQQRLIQRMDSDASIHNPARLMRLAGFLHWKWASSGLESFPISIQLNTGKIYSRGDLDKFLPGWDTARWTKETASEQLPKTDPALNVFDMRNLAIYLDGYNPNGRRKGWITCKCPAHNGRSDNSLHIEQLSGAFICHAGCNSKEVYQAAIDTAKARGCQLPERRSNGSSYRDPFAWIKEKLGKLKKTPWQAIWGKNVPAIDLELNVPPGSQASMEYSRGDRISSWTTLATTHDYIFDSSFTGSGKSYDVGSINSASFGCQHVVYVTSDPRNPTTPTLAQWSYLDGRHNGLRQDEHGKWRRTGPGQPYSVAPNCRRVETINAIREAGITRADKSDLICNSCGWLEECRAGLSTYNFLHNRKAVLEIDEKHPETKRIRCHPSSLPGSDPYFNAAGEMKLFPYHHTLVVWDEFTTLLKNSQQVQMSVLDLDQIVAHLAMKTVETLRALDEFIDTLQQIPLHPHLAHKLPDINPEVHDAIARVAAAPLSWDELRGVLCKLRSLLTGFTQQPNRYGWNHHALVSQLKPALPASIDLDDLRDATRPDLGFLNPIAEGGLDMADLKAKDRKYFMARDTTTAEIARSTLLKQWLIPFLKVLHDNPGYLHLSYGTLTITIPDNRLIQLAHKARKNIFLDATGHKEELALLLGVPVEEIAHIQQSAPPADNLRVVQVAGMGRLGISRGADQQRRASAVVDELLTRHPAKTGVIRFKQYAKQEDYRWYIESRGVNDAEHLDTLILDGIPCQNLEALAAEFTCIYGRAPCEGTQDIKIPYFVSNLDLSSQSVRSQRPNLQLYFEMTVSADRDFREFVRRRILAEIQQAMGRLRANRRPNEQLTVYVLGDFPLDMPVTLVRARDITPEAASKVERVEMAITKALLELKAAQQKVTQQAIANLTGYSQQHISRFKDLLILLTNPSISRMSKKLDVMNIPDEVEVLSKNTLSEVAKHNSPIDTLEILTTLQDVYDKDIFRWIWHGTPAQTQIEILSKLLLGIGSGELRQLVSFTISSSNRLMSEIDT